MARIFLICIILLGCNGALQEKEVVQGPQETAKVNVDTSSMLGRTECFWMISQRDTMVAVLLQTGDQVTGRLSFDNFQMDGSTGSVTGIIEDDILKLWYSFQAEGTNSMMETWFKRSEDALTRGVGPTAVRGDTSYFTDHSAISFRGTQVLRKTSCDSIPDKYK